ncbi:MAG: hypothetical protein U0L18_02615 [Acutalibacteraceae bacterium]|nr:hypothetical protein [Acutalibacteraceae bacterium]
MLNNQDIRTRAKEKGVRLYEVAQHIGKSQAYITRKLYFELPQEEKERIFAIIDELAQQKKTA